MQPDSHFTSEIITPHILIPSRTVSQVEPRTCVQVELSGHDSVRQATPKILHAALKIDILINRDGVIAIKEYTVDKQDIEMQLSANHTANILFTYGHRQRLRKHGITIAAVHPEYNNDSHLGAHLMFEDYGDIIPAMKWTTGMDIVFEEPRGGTFAQIAALDSEIVEAEGWAREEESVGRLWQLGGELVGQEFGCGLLSDWGLHIED
ncbi:uncharacterized protein BCR38DRAFT_466862 [Pseudomassariella vexata]|uniref:Uncharacterized protein n=1 Tax=Pseudomassariella vexata TaxID=1141098 RepID=A0A1Y2DSI4_9PEZI|nr:uncharacterized protein BCR38DRAFT_466862 [Pseudomassariella vexata]ORY62109.1 hypothetical protein BCR38DRAFT_466862 [Pseudomassariella vexata]